MNEAGQSTQGKTPMRLEAAAASVIRLASWARLCISSTSVSRLSWDRLKEAEGGGAGRGRGVEEGGWGSLYLLREAGGEGGRGELECIFFMWFVRAPSLTYGLSHLGHSTRFMMDRRRRGVVYTVNSDGDSRRGG